MPAMPPSGPIQAISAPPVYKPHPSRAFRLLRFFAAIVDPRAYLHALRILNYYNYTHVVPRRRLSLGPGARISPNAGFAHPERISAGHRLSLGARTQLWAGPGGGRIRMGDDVLFGPDVLVTAASYRFDDGSPVGEQAMDEADVLIGNDVWIGARAIILPGTRIGDGAVIGAGAVVSGTVPAGAVAVGVPARVVAHRGGTAEREDGVPLDDQAPDPVVTLSAAASRAPAAATGATKGRSDRGSSAAERSGRVVPAPQAGEGNPRVTGGGPEGWATDGGTTDGRGTGR